MTEKKRNISELKPHYENPMDLRGPATHECVCGSDLWNVKVMFEDDEISMYYLDMECAFCGNLASAPYPGWQEDWNNNEEDSPGADHGHC